jgi:hypothetical protein
VGTVCWEDQNAQRLKLWSLKKKTVSLAKRTLFRVVDWLEISKMTSGWFYVLVLERMLNLVDTGKGGLNAELGWQPHTAADDKSPEHPTSLPTYLFTYLFHQTCISLIQQSFHTICCVSDSKASVMATSHSALVWQWRSATMPWLSSGVKCRPQQWKHHDQSTGAHPASSRDLSFVCTQTLATKRPSTAARGCQVTWSHTDSSDASIIQWMNEWMNEWINVIKKKK